MQAGRLAAAARTCACVEVGTMTTSGHVPVRRTQWNPGRIMIGALLITLGVVAALDQAGLADAGKLIGTWWPLLIVGSGLLQLIAVPRAPTNAAIAVVIGLALLSWTTGLLGTNAMRLLWPVALIAAGVWFMLTRSGPGGAVVADPAEQVRAWALFSGRDIASHARPLRHAALTALFGGVNLDLTDAETPADGLVVEATAAFGGVEIKVPIGWRVEMTGPAIFGGYEDKTRGAVADAPLVTVRCLVLFGGTEVHN
jgi:hypothetical protein